MVYKVSSCFFFMVIFFVFDCSSARTILGPITLLPARASEQGNVIGSVRIYIYVCTKKNCN